MFHNNRKTIGVLICDIPSDYQDRLCRKLSQFANNLNYNLAFFTCYTVFGAHSENAHGEFNIINLPPYEQLDALIICADTYIEESQINTIRENIKNCNFPVISIRRPFDDHYSVLVSDEDAIPKIVRHFVREHNFTRIAFMSGPKDHPDSIVRLNSFKRTLKEEGLTFDESYLFEGDFWKKRGKQAADYYTSQVTQIPEAIVCANDYMAIALCTELVLKGYLVPDDIAISGFDNISEAANNMPPLTTLSVSAGDMAKKAIDMLDSIFAGESIEKTQFIEAKEILRSSCGCNTFDMKTLITTRVKQLKEYERIITQTLNNTFTSISLESLQNCLGIGSYLNLSEYGDSKIRNLFLCLGEAEGDTYPKYHSKSSGYADRSFSIYSIVNQKEIDSSIFDTKELIPIEGKIDEPISYFFFPLHYLNYSLGYMAISYYPGYDSDKTFNSWLSIISNALENARISNERNQLLDELNNLYVRDALTGLYNRRGFEQLSKELFEKGIEEKQTTLILCIDMDNLKTVNDVFGHAHGDLALKTIAEALKYASLHDEVCARVGGDEYSVIGRNYSQEKIDVFIKRVYNSLDEFNKYNEHDYIVDVSYGYSLVNKEDYMTLEESINLSDTKLYEQKRKKKNIAKNKV